jgi:hypothetical protein
MGEPGEHERFERGWRIADEAERTAARHEQERLHPPGPLRRLWAWLTGLPGRWWRG